MDLQFTHHFWQLLHQRIHRQSQAQWHVQRAGPDGVTLHGCARLVVEHADQLPCAQALLRQPLWQPCKAQPGRGGISNSLQIIEKKTRAERHVSYMTRRVGQLPNVDAVGAPVKQDAVPRQLDRALRPAVCGQVGRRRAYPLALYYQFTRTQPFALGSEYATANGKIKTFGQHIHWPVTETQV